MNYYKYTLSFACYTSLFSFPYSQPLETQAIKEILLKLITYFTINNHVHLNTTQHNKTQWPAQIPTAHILISPTRSTH